MKKKYMTVKEWKKLSIIEQGGMTKRYEVILTDYKEHKAVKALKRFAKKFNQENLDRALKGLDKTLDSISKGIDEFGKMAREFNVDNQKRDYSVLMGKSSKKDYSFLTGKNEKKDYSFLTGKK